MRITLPGFTLVCLIENPLVLLDKSSDILNIFKADIARDIIIMIPLRNLGYWIVVEYAFHSMAPSGAGAEAPTPLGVSVMLLL